MKWRSLLTTILLAFIFLYMSGCNRKPPVIPAIDAIIEDKTITTQWEDWSHHRAHTYDFAADVSFVNEANGLVTGTSVDVEVDGVKYPMHRQGSQEWTASVYLPQAVCITNGVINANIILDYTWRSNVDTSYEKMEKKTTTTSINVRNPHQVVIHSNYDALENYNDMELYPWMAGGEYFSQFYISNWSIGPVQITKIEVLGENPNIQIVSPIPSQDNFIVIDSYLSSQWCNQDFPRSHRVMVTVHCNEVGLDIFDDIKVWIDDEGAFDSIPSRSIIMPAICMEEPSG